MRRHQPLIAYLLGLLVLLSSIDRSLYGSVCWCQGHNDAPEQTSAPKNHRDGGCCKRNGIASCRLQPSSDGEGLSDSQNEENLSHGCCRYKARYQAERGASLPPSGEQQDQAPQQGTAPALLGYSYCFGLLVKFHTAPPIFATTNEGKLRHRPSLLARHLLGKERIHWVCSYRC